VLWYLLGACTRLPWIIEYSTPKKVADHFEQVVMTIYLNDTAKEVEVNQLEKV
jgi:hypothetical protein